MEEARLYTIWENDLDCYYLGWEQWESSLFFIINIVRLKAQLLSLICVTAHFIRKMCKENSYSVTVAAFYFLK